MVKNVHRENILGNAKFSYTLRRDTRAKHLRLSVHDDGLCVLTVPMRCSEESIEKFLVSHHEWLFSILETKRANPKPLSGYHSRNEYEKLKERARIFVLRELEDANRVYNFRFVGVSIRNQRSRWGSCSSKGRLSFHYKLLLLPRRLARYVVVHELCHLQEMNHSVRFWKLVSQSIPEYHKLRRELRRY